MAQTVYSSRLFEALALELTESITAEAGFITVVRDIDVLAYSDGAEVFFSASGALNQVFAFQAFPSGTSPYWGWRGRQVFNPGDTISFTTGGSQMDVTVSGYRLYLP